ncbi:MAG: hypothetical protein ACE5OR_10930 [bacterium]
MPQRAVYSRAYLGSMLTHLTEGLGVHSLCGEVRTEFVRQREIEGFNSELRPRASRSPQAF